MYLYYNFDTRLYWSLLSLGNLFMLLFMLFIRRELYWKDGTFLDIMIFSGKCAHASMCVLVKG